MPDSGEPDVENTRLTLYLGATVRVGDTEFSDWVKPAASYSVQWGGVPTAEQVRAAVEFSQAEILGPVIEDLIVQVAEKQAAARRKK